MSKNIQVHVGPTGHTSWVEVDGKRVRGIQSLEVKLDAQQVSELTVRMIPEDINISLDPKLWDTEVPT